MINEECGSGSTGRLCADIAAALESAGHEVRIAYGRNDALVPESCRRWAVRIGGKGDLLLHGLCARILDGAGFGSRGATAAFLRWADSWQADVIHLHNLHGYYLNVELLFDWLRRCGKPIVWTLHDVWPFTGHSAYCDAVSCEKWRGGCGRCPQRGVYPKALLDRSAANWKRKKALFTGVAKLTLVTPSAWLAGQVRDSFLGEYPVRVIPNGVDTGRFFPRESRFREEHGLADARVLLSVATVWNELKGFDDSLRLAALLDGRYRLVLVGGMTRRREARLPANVLHIPRTQSVEELAGLYSAAYAYINLTYCDTYPTVNLEAAACGLRVITYAVGGSTESALRFGGLAVPRGDVEAVAAALDSLDGTRASVPERAALDRKTAAEQYLRVYEEGRA